MNKTEFHRLPEAAKVAARAIYQADGYVVPFDKLPPGRRALYAKRGLAAAEAIADLDTTEILPPRMSGGGAVI